MDINQFLILKYKEKLQKKEERTMEETNNLDAKLNEEKAEKKLRDKKNTFTLIQILVGIFLIAVLGLLAYAFLVTRQAK